MRDMVLYLLAAPALLLAACTFTPKELNLTAEPTIADSTVGTGTALYFQFVDDREDTTVGMRGTGMGSKITAKDLAVYVEKALRDGLVNKGYTITQAREVADAAVKYRLRAFKFYINMGFWTGGENKSAAIAVEAMRDMRGYEAMYRFDDEDRDVFVPGGNELDRDMNEALAMVLTEALNDKALDRFLTAPAAATAEAPAPAAVPATGAD